MRRPKAAGDDARAVVHVTTRGGPFAGASAAVVRRRADKMLRWLLAGTRRPRPSVELSVALVDDATIRDLNRRFRGKDRPTDVLAFPLIQPARPGPP